MIIESQEKLTKRLTFRVTPSENKRLVDTAKSLGLKPSDAMRIALLSVNNAANELMSDNS